MLGHFSETETHMHDTSDLKHTIQILITLEPTGRWYPGGTVVPFETTDAKMAGMKNQHNVSKIIMEAPAGLAD